MAQRIDVNNLQVAIEDLLRDYGDLVYKATDEALAAGEKVLINNLRDASPKRTGEFAKGWRGTGKKYKLKRYVGNTTMVKGRKGEMPLSNILEYSTTKGKPFIKKTYENSINEIAAAVVAEIKKEV